MKMHYRRQLLKLLARKKPLVIAHRGYCAVAPENTLPAFKQALESGADLIELDYRHSKDGVPVVFHDRTLHRTTNARRRWKKSELAKRTVQEIQTLDAGSWFDAKFAGTEVPLLVEGLGFIISNGGVPVIEHKSGDAGTCVRLLRERRWINKVIVISFDWKYLREFHSIEPNQVLGALGPPAYLPTGRRPVHVRRNLSKRWLNKMGKTGAKVAVWNRHVSKKAIQLASRRGLKTWIYTIDDTKLAQRLMNAGVSGIITNNPDRLEALAR